MNPWQMVAEVQRKADIRAIKELMLTWGHHRILSGAPGCSNCTMARMLIAAIEARALVLPETVPLAAQVPQPGDDGVVVTVYEEGEK